MLSIEAWIMIFFSVVLLVIISFALDWRTQAPVYLVSIPLGGLFNSWITNMLVVAGYLEFPWRLFRDWTLNNVVYDLWLMPTFTLLIVYTAKKTDRKWLAMIVMMLWITLQDILGDRYSDFLIMKKWNVWHSIISAGLIFWIAYFVYLWLSKHYSRNRSLNT